MYFFSNKNLSPKSSEQCLLLIDAFRSELNPDVVAKFEGIYRRRAAPDKKSKRKKAHNNWMSGIGGPIIVGLITVLLGAFVGFIGLKLLGSRDMTKVTEPTLPSGNEDQSNPQSKVQDPAKEKQPVTPAGPKDPTASKSTESLPVMKPDVPVSPTKTEAPLVPVSPQGGAKVINPSTDKLKELEEKRKKEIQTLVGFYKNLRPETSQKVVEGHILNLSKISDDYLNLATTEMERAGMIEIHADWTKLEQNHKFFTMNPKNFLVRIKDENNDDKNDDNSVSDRLHKANKLCGELKTQEARDALKTVTEKSLLDFLPDKLALDGILLVDSKPVQRNTVTWKKDGMPSAIPLTNDPDQPNECSDDKNNFKWFYANKEVGASTLQPSQISKDAFHYTQVRKQLESKGFLPKVVSQLKAVIDTPKNGGAPYDRFKPFEDREKNLKNKPRVYDRINIVVKALAKGDLLELFPKDKKTPMATSP
jgi:hypothetical protein